MRGGTALLAVLLVAGVARGAATVVVRAGDGSPLGLPFSRFSDPALDDRGRLAFVGASTVLFRRAAGAIVHITGAGDVIEGHRLAGVGAVARASECFAFRAAFAGGGAAIVRQCGSETRLVAEIGFPAPEGGTLAGLGSDVAVGAGGRVAFTGVLGDGGSGIFLVEADGTLGEVTRTGGISPAGGTFTGFRLVGVSAGGRVGFRAVTSGGPDGLFYWDGVGLRKLRVVGDAAPAGGSFTALGQAAMNGAETWTFRALVSSGPRSGVFRASTVPIIPTVTTIALEGDPTPVGGTFQSFPTSLVPAVNGSGLVAFRATVEDSDFPSAVFVALADGQLVKVAAVGEDTPAGQLVRLREVALADDGGVVLRASLVGGTPGLFRARADGVDALALLGHPTDLGGGFRFSDAQVEASSDEPFFLGTREGLFVSSGAAPPSAVAILGDPAPLRGEWAGFDPPAGGGAQTVFGAGIQEGRTGEALFAVGRRRARVLAKSGDRVGGSARLVDLFADPLDNLARASVAPGAVAFQAALAGSGGATGIVLLSGGRLRAIARQGQDAPGAGSYREFGTPAVGRGGRLAFVALGGEGPSVFEARGGTIRLVAANGRGTATRLGDIFRGFDTPAVGAAGVAFRATLEQSREGVFLASGRCTVAIAGSGDAEPGGGRLRSFGPPAFAGRAVVFRGTIADGSATSALYRARPTVRCAPGPPSLDLLASAGTSSPERFLGFGPPAANRRGAVAVAADLTGAAPTDAIIYYTN